MLGVQCCSCVRIKLDRYRLSALGVIDSKWKFIGSNLWCVIWDFPPSINRVESEMWNKRNYSTSRDLLPVLAQDGVSDSKCFFCQMTYSQVKKQKFL